MVAGGVFSLPADATLGVAALLLGLRAPVFVVSNRQVALDVA